ncbi:uncharacterized protein LOC143180762 [Calliopsis andreniformis]|uniref:uncharacterized protein LOC143180762 n=1 Tax=Calliopsis andreniformis TaxID=337506 RepID=UPI003FCD8588
MILKFLLIFISINIMKYEAHLQKEYALNTAFEETTKFFEKLQLNHDNNTLTKINQQVSEHVSNISTKIVTRRKRDFSEDLNKGIDILKGFEDFIQLNLNNVQDVNFFSLRNEYESVWFAAILDISKISLYQINGSIFHDIATHPLTNGIQIIVNSCTYGALLIITNQDGSILVLRFANDGRNYYLYPIQNFESNVTHLTVWNGMNKLYLGIASHSRISIFTWLGDYFDLVQTINHDTKKLIPFYSKGFMYLAATGSTTSIFKYLLRSNEFVLTQRLPFSQDVSSFQLREGHFTEHFLSLSTEYSVIIYKEIHDRFVPFQQISSGRSTVPIISNKVILLLSLYKDTVLTHQYDGWKFVELEVKLPEVHQFRHITLYEKELLLVNYKNNTWTLKQPVWTKRKSYKNLQEEIKAWNIDAMKTTQRTLQEIPDLKNSIRILKGHINQLRVHNINEHNSQALRNVSHRYKKVISKLQEQKSTLSNKLHSKNLIFPSLHAKQIRINCKEKCKINHLKVKEYPKLLSKLKENRSQNQIFKIVSVQKVKNLKCPLLSLPIKNTIVSKSINGVLLDNLEKNLLKVIGDQEILGEHIFSSMNVTNAFIPLDIAFNLTKQEIQAKELKVRELSLIDGGFLLPLNGPPTVITGSIKASKVRSEESIFLRAGVKGNWKKYVSPVIVISEPMTVNRDIMLEDAKIENLKSKDLIANQTGSIKDILLRAVLLRDNVPVPLKLSSDKIVWNNITLHSSQNWVTANSQERITINGRKHVPHNVTILKTSYENLKIPKIEIPLCGATIIVPEVKTSILFVNSITVKHLNSRNIFGNLGEKYLSQNGMFLFKPLNLSAERLYHNVIMKNISIIRINNMDFAELKDLVNSWIKPNILKKSIETLDLVVNTLQSPVQLRVNLPKIIGNIISKENIDIDNINNINFIDFLANSIKLEDMISLGNITFNNFTTNHIYASDLPLTLIKLEQTPNLYTKRIVGKIKTKAINLPNSFSFLENDVPLNIIVKGSSIFSSEPAIQNIDKIKLEELFTNIWMKKDMTIFYGKNLQFIKNVSIQGNITSHKFDNILNPETWRNQSRRILSKTQSQEITVYASLNNVETPVIIGSNVSKIKSTVPDFNDMFENALVRNREQKVKAKWTFNKLKVLGKLHARKKINDLNLKTDVMRYSNEEIIVTGKKTVMILTTENMNGLHFDKWTKNALTQKKKMPVIKGHKTFNAVAINEMNVSGKVMGHHIKDVLLKSADQTISGSKSIQGSINASILVIDGLINDVNLTTLLNHQLQKQKSLQQIKTELKLQNSLTIVGNLTINGSYRNANLKNFYKNYSNVTPIAHKIRKYSKAAEIINTALRSRAIYINKLEIAKEANITEISNKDITSQKNQCDVENFPRLCANENIVKIILKINSTDFVLIKSISLDGDEFIVWIKFNSVSIYLYNHVEKNLSHLQDLHVPKVIDAFVESVASSLWIALKLPSQTLVLHYQPWKDLQEYILPATDVFIMSRSPNGQLLLLLSDGVWNLEGLASPLQIIGIPLNGKTETFVNGLAYYVKCTSKNNTTLMRARYVGN